MRFAAVLPDLWRAASGGVNVHLVERDGALVLLDAGTPAMAAPILRALAGDPHLGRLPLTDVVLTHAHYDHAGGAAQIGDATGARVWLHPLDAALCEAGRWRRPAKASPTLHGRVVKRLVADRYPDRLPALTGTEPIGERIDVAGGIDVLATPGHCLGQVALSWTSAGGTRVVHVGDALMHLLGPREPILYEDRTEGLRSIARLADRLREDDLVLFGHGSPLRARARVLARIERLGRTVSG